MAKIYQLGLVAVDAGSQSDLNSYGHSLLFADSIQPVYTQTEGGNNRPQIVVTSGVESTDFDGAMYQLLADDSQSEVSVDISTGKFVEGNLIVTWATVSEAQADLRDFMTFYSATGDIHLHVGVCNTTQSQDYTPAIIENSRAKLMISPAQVESLGL